MADDSNQTPRQFNCKDPLWDAFEQLGGDLGVSVDYLINEAMRQYLRTHGAGASRPQPRGIPPMPGAQPGPSSQGMVPALPRSGGPPPAPQRPVIPTLQNPSPRPPMTTPGAGNPPPMPGARPPGGIPPLPGSPSGRPPMPGMPAPAQHQQHQQQPRIPSWPAPPMPQTHASPSGPPGMPQMPPMPAQHHAPPMPAPMQHPGLAPASRVLYAMCDGDTVAVNKDEFWIGRGQRLCDLVIRDANVSRQHARVVLHNGQYWIADNGSTNGIEFRGAKIQQKPIENGDTFLICGHELRFLWQ